MEPFLKSNDDFRNLQVYKIAVIISVATDIFVKKFINSRSRTVDQMQQAARSCKQNLIEGSEASLSSKETEIKLTNVARASLGELLEDYEDFLRFNSLRIWGKEHPRTHKLRGYLKEEAFEKEYVAVLQRLSGEEFSNLMITLIRQERYLIDGLLRKQQERFLAEGGIREAMTRERLKARANNAAGNQSYQSSPGTPKTPSHPTLPSTPNPRNNQNPHD